jgi:hypothetical protein
MGSDLVHFNGPKQDDTECARCCTSLRSEYHSGKGQSQGTCNSRATEVESCGAVAVQSDEVIRVIFTTTMNPTLFAVSEPAIDGSRTIVPQFDHSASLNFTKTSVMKMIVNGSITVKETGKPNPKTATCNFPTAGPITGAPTCRVFFMQITMGCTCDNFPRTAVNTVVV